MSAYVQIRADIPTNSTTRTVETAHGDVTYETVECASCGAEVATDDATRFVIGREEDRNEWSHRNVVEVEFDASEFAEGWTCSYCRESGPADYPRTVTSRLGRAYERHVLDENFTRMRFGVFLYVLLPWMAVLFLTVALLA